MIESIIGNNFPNIAVYPSGQRRWFTKPLLMGSNPITASNFEFNIFYDIIDVK